MTDIYEFQGFWNDGRSKGPVYIMDSKDNVDEYATSFTGKWLLTAELYVQGGGKIASWLGFTWCNQYLFKRFSSGSHFLLF